MIPGIYSCHRRGHAGCHEQVLSLAIRFLTYVSPCLTDPIMRLTLLNWHLRLPVQWHSRRHEKADPVLLEPIMKVDVQTPDDYLGDVIGDLNSRRGRIEAWRLVQRAQRTCVRTSVRMFGYATDRRDHVPRAMLPTPCRPHTMRRFPRVCRKRLQRVARQEAKA